MQLIMATKKKGNYLCKSKVECLTCGAQVMSENEKLHVKNKHNGDATIKFRLICDSKQPRLDFFTKKDVNANLPSTSSSLTLSDKVSHHQELPKDDESLNSDTSMEEINPIQVEFVEGGLTLF